MDVSILSGNPETSGLLDAGAHILTIGAIP
jgi:hypothetical protein